MDALGVSYKWDKGYAVHGEAVASDRGGAGEIHVYGPTFRDRHYYGS